ncbi:probable LRR receptor-like serine/threonine-protein kinase At3g47570 [Morus notabilis]|uniref:probable LRR receptor-like serine/threonine-protein kinase At3g47570 n=1 Tax=Morus notabilis TaxID=981085 RepID=UPI000CED0856|nr:probable LRR receptor-like serine/threonine-protein kinase At3g47570 [Morus notabilis]
MRAVLIQTSSFLSLLNFCIKILTLAIIAIVGVTTASIVHGNITDRLALLAIKAQITEDPLGITSSWNDSLHFCQWHGVSCGHKHQRVTQVNLRSLSLKGSISLSVGNLSFLRTLDVSNNSFHGELPNEIGRLLRLQQLVLANNSFGGRIPTSLSNCSKLISIDFGYNAFTGNIPSEIGFLPTLEQLILVRNSLEGSIPPHLGNISSLKELIVSANKLKGNVPASLGQLKSLISFRVSLNMLSGTIPEAVFNLSSLVAFSVCGNQLQGSFPRNIGLTLPNIETFFAWGNQFSGTIPVSFSNASNLVYFEIEENNFFGRIPTIFGNLKKLERVVIGASNLGYGKENDMDFFTSLTNCSNLLTLQIQQNNFGGNFPNSVGNLTDKLEVLCLANSRILGNISPSIGNLMNLKALYLGHNRLTGTIPTTIGKLRNLGSLYLAGNELSGEIPSSLGNLTLLNTLQLEDNNLQGNIPSSLENCKNLQLLHLHGNSLNGTIPPNVIGLSSLSLSLTLSRNRLTGSLPSEVGNLKNLAELGVSHNQLTGDIPSTLAECTSLRWLSMDHNMFEGTIESLSSLKAIEELDLSHNNISGHIPEDFGKFVFLSKLDLSFNDLEGEVPSGGVFSNASANISLAGNDKLCGGIANLHLAQCSKKSPRKQNLSSTRKLIISIVCSLLGVCLMSVFLIICCFRKKRKQQSLESLSGNVPFLNISYAELLKATNGFCPENLIGFGGFGSVYKGILEPHQLPIAAKVFDLERRGASKSFMAECETLRNVRHRNLVKIITSCSSVDFQGNDFKALIYELMPNGSLEDWLHPPLQMGENQRKSLPLTQRLNIVIDVASALDYLHNHSGQPIIHCDLKPSNVLLDQDMTAHVGDFGLSRIIAENNVQISQNQTSSVGIRGTIGYAAPEYGMGTKVSIQGDVYSFGILLLEIFTGKKPTNENLEGLSLHQFVKITLPERAMEIVYQSLPKEGQAEASRRDIMVQPRSGRVYECLMSILTTGLKCSEELPGNRMKINYALKDLQKIKNMLLKDTRNNSGARILNVEEGC